MKNILPLRTTRYRLVNDLPGKRGAVIPAGSIFRIEKACLNRATKSTDHIWIIFVMSPDPSFGQRKYGGNCPYGYEISITWEEVNALEVEIVEGMT